jgi:signal transduction histidine kinase
MKFLPRSLFSRLVLVLLIGLATAQLLSFAIHMHDRTELLQETSGMQSAQRIADIVRLLESLAPAERRRISDILSTPPMLVSLNRPPFVAPEQSADRQARAALFGAFLRRSLGEAWPVEVAMTDSRPFLASPPGGPPGGLQGGHMGPGMGSGMGPGMGRSMEGQGMPAHAGMPYFSRPALSFVAQVRLRDGSLVTFDTRQPAQTENWPYRMLLSLVVLLIAVMLVSLIAVRWATRPLKALADAAEELGKNINHPPLSEAGPLEVARAARAFNTMQARLIRYIDERTRALAAMSHDLKTPITRLRLRAELLEDQALRAKFSGDLAEMEALVTTTLDFMRGVDTGEAAKPVDMKALLESLQADLSEAGGSVSIESVPLQLYVGKPQALKRCLTNLMENAVKYGKRAMVAIDDNDTRLMILIRDEGPGIPEAELEKVFEPFYRLEASRNRDTGGTGLGLTIARSIAEAHGGTLSLHNRSEGGLEVRLVLPRRKSAMP